MHTWSELFSDTVAGKRLVILLTAFGLIEENTETSKGAMFTADETRVKGDRIFIFALFHG